MTRRRQLRRLKNLLPAFAVSGLALMAIPAAGAAHAEIVSSSPAAGARLPGPPAVVEATFSEPLNRPLSNLTLQTASGAPIRVASITAASTKLTLHPLHRLTRGVYQVRWHSVSADDGHTAEGAYRFGVAAPLAGPESRAAVNSAGASWFALVLRFGFDGALILFCGGLFCAAMLSPRGRPGAWLVATGRQNSDAVRPWRLTVGLGIATVALSVATTLREATRAAGGLSAQAVHGYLTADVAGWARVAVTVALLASVLLAVHHRARGAGALALAALAALVVGGHARSAHSPAIAMTSDLVHLAAASVWIGGMVSLAVVWLPRIRRVDAAERRAALGVVLPRFGRLALPAFVLVVGAGAATAATELPSLSALWTDDYGRALTVKAGLVLLIACLSYLHALRLRPRLVASLAHQASVERRRWRLLAAEPPLAAGVLIAAAWLVVLGPATAGTPGPPRSGRELAAERLYVAGQAGPYIVTAVVSRQPRGVHVVLRTLDALERPVAFRARVGGSARQRRCGTGCVEGTLSQPPPVLAVGVNAHGHTYRASLPVQFLPGSRPLARRLVSEVARSSTDLRSVAIEETLGSGSGPIDVTHYRVRGPNRFAYRLGRGGQAVGDTIIVGTRQWTREASRTTWKAGRYGGGGAGFSTAAYLNWWAPYVTQPRLLDIVTAGGEQQADVAAASDVADLGTVWLRLRVDVSNRRILRLQMITAAHFMTQTWTGFNAPTRIQPPAALLVGESRRAGTEQHVAPRRNL